MLKKPEGHYPCARQGVQTERPARSFELLQMQRQAGDHAVARLVLTAQRYDQTLNPATAAELGGNAHTGGGASAINTGLDSHTRIRQYVDEARRVSRQVLDDLNSGRISHEEARRLASGMRNEALRNTRARLTPGGRVMSQAIKEEGKTLDQLVAMYSERIVRRSPERLGFSRADAENAARVREAARTIETSEEVSRAIISSAGRTSRTMTVAARLGQGCRAGEWVAEDAFTAVTQAPVPAAPLWGSGGGYGGLMRRDFERAFGPAIRAQQGGTSSGGER